MKKIDFDNDSIKKNILKIELVVENISAKEVLSSIKKKIKGRDNIKAVLKNDVINIEICSEE